jgi:hypothetical protein
LISHHEAAVSLQLPLPISRQQASSSEAETAHGRSRELAKRISANVTHAHDDFESKRRNRSNGSRSMTSEERAPSRTVPTHSATVSKSAHSLRQAKTSLPSLLDLDAPAVAPKAGSQPPASHRNQASTSAKSLAVKAQLRLPNGRFVAKSEQKPRPLIADGDSERSPKSHLMANRSHTVAERIQRKDMASAREAGERNKSHKSENAPEIRSVASTPAKFRGDLVDESPTQLTSSARIGTMPSLANLDSKIVSSLSSTAQRTHKSEPKSQQLQQARPIRVESNNNAHSLPLYSKRNQRPSNSLTPGAKVDLPIVVSSMVSSPNSIPQSATSPQLQIPLYEHATTMPGLFVSTRGRFAKDLVTNESTLLTYQSLAYFFFTGKAIRENLSKSKTVGSGSGQATESSACVVVRIPNFWRTVCPLFCVIFLLPVAALVSCTLTFSASYSVLVLHHQIL